MKKTYLTTFEFEKTEMEMPKLNQFDLDELFKPVEMPKIKWVKQCTVCHVEND